MIANIPFLHLAGFLFINLATAVIGFILLKSRLLKTAWLFMVFVLTAVYLLFAHQHPAMCMLAIIAVTFTAMKPIPAIIDYRHKPINLSFKQWMNFALAWAGMRVQPFEKLDTPPLPNAAGFIGFGVTRLMFGMLLIVAAMLLSHQVTITPFTYTLINCLLLVGLSFILHFGLLSISAGTLRKRGVNVDLLFKSPARSHSLTEFWGKRWNLAFSQMTAIAIFKPLKMRIGSGWALMASFAFSGLLHEVALSLPVNSGYGLPTLYFLLQGVLVLIEKRWLQNSMVLQNRVLAKLWTFCWIVLPATLLFHAQFIRQIIWPLTAISF